MNKLPLIVFSVLAVLFALMFIQGKDTSYVSTAMLGKPVPEFAVKGLSSADLKGEIVILNVFASWCPSCVIEHPVLAAIAKEEKVKLYGLAYKDDPAKTRAWLQKHGNIYHKVGHDRDGQVAINFGVSGTPETFVIDAKGIIQYRYAGPITEKVYKEEIKPVLQRSKQ